MSNTAPNDDSITRHNFKLRCCDPFKCHKQWMRNGLRQISDMTRQSFPSLHFIEGDKVCTSCRKRISKLPPEVAAQMDTASLPEDDCEEGTSADDEQPENEMTRDLFVSTDHDLSVLNQSLGVLGESPVVKRKIDTQANYARKKVSSIQTSVKRKLQLITGKVIEEDDSLTNTDYNPETEMIDQLKEKFQSSTKTSDKMQILSVLPKSWSIRRTEKEFKASNYLVRKAKKLVDEKGILSTPNPKAGKSLQKETVEEVKHFYCCDTVSRQMPGMKDCVSVTIDGKRLNVQKRLILSNLKEVFALFKEKYPEHQVGFSKFADLRPKQCVLAGAAGTHAVCVCTIHQNVKLMFQGARLETLTDGYNYHNCLAEIQCNPPRVQCYLGACLECPGVTKLREKLEVHFDEHVIDRIEFKQWTTTDRSTLETKVQSADEFITCFTSAIPKVVHHDFIAKQQSYYLQSVKCQLKPGEFLVIGDFAENYSFVVQDAAQSFHWNNLQATIHPFVCYYMDKAAENDHAESSQKMKHVSFVVISEGNTHDTVAVHLFQKVLINFLTTEIYKPTKVIYFSDGCAAQYKNRKNFINVCHHIDDFGMPAEWNFFATSHGKGPCDGVGGTVKRLAARASLQRPLNNQIMTPQQLFEFAKSSIASISFYYATVEEYEIEACNLKTRFDLARTIAGTHKIHCIRPITQELVEVREFSTSEQVRVERVSLSLSTIPRFVKIATIKGYVTAKYDGHWWLACVIRTIVESDEVEVSFLHPHGPSRSFKYPHPTDILIMSCQDILSTVEPRTITGRSYTLSDEEVTTAAKRLAVGL